MWSSDRYGGISLRNLDAGSDLGKHDRCDGPTYCIYTINCYLQAYVTLNISPAHITSGTNTIRLRLERTL